MTQAKTTPAKVQGAAVAPPSSLSEVADRLDGIERKLDLVLAALTTAANEAAEVHQERVALVRRVAALERWRADMEDRFPEEQPTGG